MRQWSSRRTSVYGVVNFVTCICLIWCFVHINSELNYPICKTSKCSYWCGFSLASGKLTVKRLKPPLLTLVSYGTRSWRGWPLWGIQILDLWSTFWQGIKCRKTDRSSCCKSHNISLRHVIVNSSPSMETTLKDGASSCKARGCGCITWTEEDWEGAPGCLWHSSYAIRTDHPLFPSSKRNIMFWPSRFSSQYGTLLNLPNQVFI